MSLWVGHISRNVRSSQLEDEFNEFGRCDIKRNVSKTYSAHSLTVQRSYAFIEYENEKDAEDA
jgi:RNA recognition motif-containing protein